MTEVLHARAQFPPVAPTALRVPSGRDRFGETHSLGISTIEFKMTSHEETGALIVEHKFHARGGPARHLHHDQDEWFYVVEGGFRFEVGEERFLLLPGDSLLAPRRVPHAWAFVGEGTGRILVSFTPAGKMEAFFREVARAGAMPPQEPDLWRAHGMELWGPPLETN